MDDAGAWLRWLAGGFAALVTGWLIRLENRFTGHAERREVDNLERDLRAELTNLWSAVNDQRKALNDLSGDFRALQAQVADMKERLGTVSQEVSTTLRIVSRLEARQIGADQGDRGLGQQ